MYHAFQSKTSYRQTTELYPLIIMNQLYNMYRSSIIKAMKSTIELQTDTTYKLCEHEHRNKR